VFCAFIFFPHAFTCSAHLALIGLIILRVSGEEYKLWSFALCSFLYPPVTSFLLGQNIVTLDSTARRAEQWLCKQVTKPGPSLAKESASSNGETIGIGVFCAIRAETI
jgi:hypothetical protein